MKKRMLGFTFIELIAVIVIISIISVIVSNILFNSFRMFRVSQDVTDTDWQGLLVTETIANDVHNIRSALDITTVTSTSFSFVDMSGNTVTYQLSGGNVLRTSITLASNVTALSFNYFDKNGTTTTTPSAVRYVTASVTESQNGIVKTFTTMVGTRGMT